MLTRPLYRLALGAVLARACASGFAQTLTTINIGGLPAAGPLTGTELIPIEQGHTVAASTSQIETLIASNANTWTAAQIFAGVTTLNAASTFTSSVVLGCPTGGPKGAGLLNATTIWANGVQLAPGISSLSLSVPSWLMAAGSPCGAGSCALSLTSSTEPANCVLAAPNGSAGALACRSLLAADLPSIPASQITGAVTAGQGGSGVTATLSPLQANGSSTYTVATGAQLTAQFSGASSTCWFLGNGACADVLVNAVASTGGVYSGSTGAITTAMGSTGGGANGFNLRHGFNAWWNGTNWITGTDNVNNGGSLLTFSYGSANLNFYAQAISNSSLAGFLRLSLTNTAGAFRVPVTAPSFSGSLNGNATTATALAATTAPASLAWTAGDLTMPGTVTGPGSGLTAINASNISTGTGSAARLPASATVSGTWIFGTAQQGGTAIQNLPMATATVTASRSLTVADCGTLHSGSATVAQGSGLTLFDVGTTTGNRTLTGASLVTVTFDSSSTAMIAGGGMS